MKRNHFVVFLFGVIFAQKINFVGWIYIGEILSCLYIFINLQKLRFSNFEKQLMLVSAFALVLQLFLDLYHNVEMAKLSKSAASYIVFPAVIIFLSRYLWSNKDFKIPVVFFIGTLLGGFITIFYMESILFFSNPWKWGIGGILIFTFLIVPLYYNYEKDVSKVFLIAFSIVVIFFSLLYYSRYLLLVYGLSLISYWLFHGRKESRLKFFNKKSTFWLLPTIYFFIILAVGAIFIKVTPAQFETYFEKAAERNVRQGQGQFGIILGARADVISAFYAIKDKPLLGHGSYPADENLKYKIKQIEFLLKYNYIQQFPDQGYISILDESYIPSHSFLFNAMVTAGILGCIYWLFLTYFMVKNYVNHLNYLPLFFFTQIIFYFCNLFLSPWGGPTRIRLAIFFGLFILYLELVKKIKSEKQQNKKANESDNLLS